MHLVDRIIGEGAIINILPNENRTEEVGLFLLCCAYVACHVMTQDMAILFVIWWNQSPSQFAVCDISDGCKKLSKTKKDIIKKSHNRNVEIQTVKPIFLIMQM